ncbi:MAG: bifunctional DNA-formamidopyrimidine glycosylase/DNA-(apurinic or apyrimidinic site) lyase [Burkholderiales bacterium]
MPELPEVEITRRGLEAAIVGKRVKNAIVRRRSLRWAIPQSLSRKLAGREIAAVRRRGKYLIVDLEGGALIMHLGMSGSLRVVNGNSPANSHEHFDLALADGTCVRLRDPRRFGAVLWTARDPLRHPLLVNLGPEPLSREFDARMLYFKTRGKSAPIKNVLMDSRVIAGVGNIYANEALFRARISPQTRAGKLSMPRLEKLASAIVKTLRLAIASGGTTLRDFTASDGELGCFQTKCFVYDRDGERCLMCCAIIRCIRQSGRASYYCPRCQRV